MVQPTQLASLKTILNGFEPYSVAGKELKSVLSLYMNMTPQPEKGQIISGLQDALPVETLFHHDIIRGPTVLYKVLRDYLVLQGHTYTAYPGKITLAMVLLIASSRTPKTVTLQLNVSIAYVTEVRMQPLLDLTVP